VFFYLLCLVPTIWLLELDELEKRIAQQEREQNVTTPTPMVRQQRLIASLLRIAIHDNIDALF